MKVHITLALAEGGLAVELEEQAVWAVLVTLLAMVAMEVKQRINPEEARVVSGAVPSM